MHYRNAIEVKGQETDQARKARFVDLLKGHKWRRMKEDDLFTV